MHLLRLDYWRTQCIHYKFVWAVIYRDGSRQKKCTSRMGPCCGLAWTMYLKYLVSMTIVLALMFHHMWVAHRVLVGVIVALALGQWKPSYRVASNPWQHDHDIHVSNYCLAIFQVSICSYAQHACILSFTPPQKSALAGLAFTFFCKWWHLWLHLYKCLDLCFTQWPQRTIHGGVALVRLHMRERNQTV